MTGLSFETIASSGPNAAIVHYQPKKGIRNRVIGKEMFLMDAGAHFLFGTTDTSRTIHCGTPSDEEKEFYTRVLMGHINVAKAVFPRGTHAQQLDILVTDMKPET